MVLTTIGTDALDLDRGGFYCKTDVLSSDHQGGNDGFLLHLPGTTTDMTNHELGTMRHLPGDRRATVVAYCDMRAPDKSRQTFQTMDQSLVQQEAQRTIDGRWCRIRLNLAEMIQQVISADRTFGRQNEPEDITPRFCQTNASCLASLRCTLKLGLDRTGRGRYDSRTGGETGHGQCFMA